MEVDAAALDHVVENTTYRLLEPVTTPLGRRRANLMPPPPPTQQPLNIEETEDSLSFPPIKFRFTKPDCRIGGAILPVEVGLHLDGR
jgi:hypothetical protein